MTTISVGHQPRVLADAIVKNRTLVKDAALVVTGTIIVSLLAQVSIPLWPVPITGLTLGVVIVGASLGARRGTAALALYLVLGLAGLPIFANFTGGPASVLKPSFGFIIGSIIAAGVIGWLAERQWDRKPLIAFAGFVIASAIPFAVGLPWLSVALGNLGLPHDLNATLQAGLYPFILGGFIKAAIAATLVPLAWLAVRKLDRR